jgi:hypothetical protein
MAIAADADNWEAGNKSGVCPKNVPARTPYLTLKKLLIGPIDRSAASGQP